MAGQRSHALRIFIELSWLAKASIVMSTTAWILKPRGSLSSTCPDSRLRLFCFPMAGSGAYMYHGWELPEGVEVMPVELPGHNSRAKEACIRSMAELVQATATALMPLFQEAPFAFFGHSMGAWVAFALTQELQRRGGPLPLRLYASANRSPTLAGAANDVDPVTMHLLPKAEFWAHMEARYGKNPDLEDRHMRNFAERALRADFQVLETYQPASLGRLPCWVLALGGRHDRRLRVDQLEAWRAVAPVGQFLWRLFEGGHDYVSTNRAELLHVLGTDLSLLLRWHGDTRQAQEQGQEEGSDGELPVSSSPSFMLPPPPMLHFLAAAAQMAAAEQDSAGTPAVIAVEQEGMAKPSGSPVTAAVSGPGTRAGSRPGSAPQQTMRAQQEHAPSIESMQRQQCYGSLEEQQKHAAVGSMDVVVEAAPNDPMVCAGLRREFRLCCWFW